MELEKIFECIEMEPELPGHIEPELWSMIKHTVEQNDSQFIVEMLRLCVRLTKQGIRNRVALEARNTKLSGYTRQME